MLYKNKGYKKDALLVPGWALDYKILEKLPLKYNLIIPLDYNFENELHLFIKEKILVLGHSIGAFLSFNFACKYPSLIERLILIGIRKGYKKEKIELMKQNLKKNKKATLYGFYKASFLETEFLEFKRSFLDYYLTQPSEILLRGLEYLALKKINAKSLKNIENVVILHGLKDAIAPINEAISLAKRSKKELILMDFAHIPFFNKGFLEWIEGL